MQWPPNFCLQIQTLGSDFIPLRFPCREKKNTRVMKVGGFPGNLQRPRRVQHTDRQVGGRHYTLAPSTLLDPSWTTAWRREGQPDTLTPRHHPTYNQAPAVGPEVWDFPRHLTERLLSEDQGGLGFLGFCKSGVLA